MVGVCVMEYREIEAGQILRDLDYVCPFLRLSAISQLM